MNANFECVKGKKFVRTILVCNIRFVSEESFNGKFKYFSDILNFWNWPKNFPQANQTILNLYIKKCSK